MEKNIGEHREIKGSFTMNAAYAMKKRLFPQALLRDGENMYLE